METQEMILLLAEYMDQGLDPETVSALEQELNYHPKAALFLLNYRYTLLFYKRHHHDEKLGWMVEYLAERMPGSLKELVQHFQDTAHKSHKELVPASELRAQQPYLTKGGLTMTMLIVVGLLMTPLSLIWGMVMSQRS